MIGCAGLLAVGCAGVRSEAPKEEERGHTEATKQEQGRSPEATASEEARCGGTRTIDLLKGTSVIDSSVEPGDPEALFITNDVAGCPTGGLLSGTDEPDRLAGEDGEDEVRGLGASDELSGGYGSDTIYGGPGGDELQGGGWAALEGYEDTSKNVLYGGPGRDMVDGEAGDDVLYGGDGDDKFIWGGMKGADVLYGGDGNDFLNGASDVAGDTRPNKLYCGKGRDEYVASKIDYVSSSCEERATGGRAFEL